MAGCHYIALLLVLSVCASGHPGTQQYYTDEGGDGFSCTEDNGAVRPCHILEYAAEQTANSSGPVTIAIHSSHSSLNLSRPVMFKNISHLRIQGNNTLISCSNGSGLMFQFVTKLGMSSVSLSGCGIKGHPCTAAVHIQTCTNVTIQNVSISWSVGAALVLQNTVGRVFLSQLLISHNGNIFQYGCSNGIHVRLTQCNSGWIHADYIIDKCNFINNTAYTDESMTSYSGYGGGLGIRFTHCSCFANIAVTSCNFTQNCARWGGGLLTQFQGLPRDNHVRINASQFVANRAKGGGGANIGYLLSENNEALFRNRVTLQDTFFFQNWARFGGGTTIFAQHSATMSSAGDTIIFTKSTWHQNSAIFSPAVDIAPSNYDTLTVGFFPIPVFIDCIFTSNRVQQNEYDETFGTRNAAGAFLVTKFAVQFEGQLVFENHSYSPLQIVSGTINFQVGSSVLFQSNTGIQGGAIAMYGFASLNVKDNSSFRFINNTARDVGGAIYFQSLDQHDFASSRTCFIQYGGSERNIQSRNLTMIFTGNTANRAGDSIFATSLYPCYLQHFNSSSEHNILDFFQQIATFHEISNKTVATEGKRFEHLWTGEALHVIPGKDFKLPIGIRDELDHSIDTLFRIDTTTDSRIECDRTYTDKRPIRLFGRPGDNGSMHVYSVSFREIAIPVKISFLNCPPGYFYYLGRSQNGRCKCAAYFQERAYHGIVHCNSSLFQAYIQWGYWAGYTSSGHATPDGLHTALCPLGFCSYELASAGPLFPLPNISSREVLDDWMCGHYRTGILCGKCDRGYSAYYHSHQYRCATSDNCRLGVLYYILSELLPLTILFTTVIVFDIRFTSGALNGFVFFSQVLDTLSIDARGAIKFPTGVDTLSIVYSVLYGLLNFDFLGIEQLSFCLWENATVLDVVAFKYVTVVYALILVVALVTLMRWCNCRQLCKIKRKISAKDSVIHGLTTFLIMCYVQCTRVSFRILTAVTLTGKGGHSGLQVTFYGGLPYLDKEHLPYAIPAITCIVTIVATPPIVLVVFPLCNHALVWFGLLIAKKRFNESTVIEKVTRFLLVNQLKPLLDSFQGCFKDKLRFFAGLYFVYRIAILAAYTFSRTPLQFYVIVEILIVFMLVLHATAQPYITRIHNVIDSLVFGNLALINAFIIYNFYHRFNPPGPALYWIQLVLIYLPLVSMAVFIFRKIAILLKARMSQNQLETYVSYARDPPDGYIDHNHLPYHELELCPRARETSPLDTRPDFGIDSD